MSSGANQDISMSGNSLNNVSQNLIGVRSQPDGLNI